MGHSGWGGETGQDSGRAAAYVARTLLFYWVHAGITCAGQHDYYPGGTDRSVAARSHASLSTAARVDPVVRRGEDIAVVTHRARAGRWSHRKPPTNPLRAHGLVAGCAAAG